MLSFEGECVGNLLRYCVDDAVVEVDCPSEYTMNTVCMEIEPSYGFGCAVAIGEQCYYDDGEDGIIVVACQGVQAGCVENASTAVCVENVGPCTTDQEGSCNAQGGLIVLCPEFKQPNILDCISLGGQCGPGRCSDIPVGGYCDDLYAFCAMGLECSEAACVPDAQMPPSDAGLSDLGSADVNTPSRPDAGFGFPTDSGASGGSQTRAQSKQRTTASCSCESMNSQGGRNDRLIILFLLGVLIGIRRLNSKNHLTRIQTD